MVAPTLFHGTGEGRFAADDGSADPAAAATLADFAAARGSEHAALTALAGARLLVPIVAVLADDTAARADQTGPADKAAAQPAPGPAGAEKSSEMAMPTLVGRDGRAAIPVFTSLAALVSWQPSARPVPVGAEVVWQSAVADACAVVIDIAGPVPLAVEGDRLAALAKGAPVPLPHEDADIAAAIAAVVAAESAPAPLGEAGGFRLLPGREGGDLLIELAPPPGARVGDPASAGYAERVGSAVMRLLGGRLRRGIELSVTD